VSPPLEAPPLAAALLTVGPRGFLPLYIVPPLCNRSIQFNSHFIPLTW
jgi:hypothetical protein